MNEIKFEFEYGINNNNSAFFSLLERATKCYIDGKLVKDKYGNG